MANYPTLDLSPSGGLNGATLKQSTLPTAVVVTSAGVMTYAAQQFLVVDNPVRHTYDNSM